MSLISSSVSFQVLLFLWRHFLSAWHESGLCRLWERFSGWLAGKWSRSFLVHLFYDESRLSRDWGPSRTRAVLEWVLNLPLRLLQGIYRLLRRPFERSFFASLAFETGREACLAAAWCVTLILLIPYEHWSNGYSVLLFAGVFLLLLIGGMNESRARLSLLDVGPYLICFFGAVVLSVPLSDYPELSGRYLIYYASCALAILVVVNGVQTSRQLLRAAGGLAVGILAAAGYGIYQGVFIGVEVNASFVDLTVNAGMPGRVYSYFENPNALGELLLLGLPILVALMFGSHRWYSRLAAAGVFAVGLVCMAMTLSRASWVGLAAAAFIYVFLWNRRLIPLGIAAAIAAIPLLPDYVLNRILTITNLNDTSTASRFPQLEAALRLLSREPVTGAGLGADAVRQAVRIQTLYQGYAPFVHAHNTLLQIWAENGLVGVLSFAGGVIWMVKAAARGVKTCPDPAARHMAIGGTAAILGAMVCGLADYIWTYPRIMFIFWFIFALTLAAIKVCNSQQERV